MTGFYYVLHSETPEVQAAAVAAFPVAPQTAECTVSDGAQGFTQAGFSAAKPLPGHFLLVGVYEALTREELLAVLETGATLSDHPKAPGLQGFDTRVTEVPPEPEPDEDAPPPDGEPEPEA